MNGIYIFSGLHCSSCTSFFQEKEYRPYGTDAAVLYHISALESLDTIRGLVEESGYDIGFYYFNNYSIPVPSVYRVSDSVIREVLR